ncbi:MAG: hypothetical protein PHX13_00980 [Thiovulaceae bacterium]|nr:hypothetical protein [Sulfurimonadaceae bacterium]
MKSTIRARLIDSTNFSVLTNYKDCEGTFYVDHGMVFIDNEKALTSHTLVHRTSLIVDLSLEDDILSVKTLNSLYKYKILKGTKEEISKEFEKIDLVSLQEAENERSIKTSNYLVQDVNGFIKQITLPCPMSWDEAAEFLFKVSPVRILKAIHD